MKKLLVQMNVVGLMLALSISCGKKNDSHSTTQVSPEIPSSPAETSVVVNTLPTSNNPIALTEDQIIDLVETIDESTPITYEAVENSSEIIIKIGEETSPTPEQLELKDKVIETLLENLEAPETEPAVAELTVDIITNDETLVTQVPEIDRDKILHKILVNEKKLRLLNEHKENPATAKRIEMITEELEYLRSFLVAH